jgi:TetR/AcrR family transcriptional regulator, transcriptional repressor for nem operon
LNDGIPDAEQALTLQAVDLHWQRQHDDWTAVLATTEPALDRLHHLLARTTAEQRLAHRRDGVVSGCVLADLALELSGQEPAVQERLRQIFDEQVDLVRALLGEAAADGSIPDGEDRRGAARAVLAQLEGLLLFAKVADDPTVLADVWPHTLSLLGAGPAPRHGRAS